MEKELKKRCQYSKKGIEVFGKQKRGYVLGESKSKDCWRVLWDKLTTPMLYAKDFIEINPLIDLIIDEDGVEKEKPIEEIEKESVGITPETILFIEKALEQINKTGISERGLEVLIKDYCGTKFKIIEIREVLKAVKKLKSYYFPNQLNN